MVNTKGTVDKFVNIFIFIALMVALLPTLFIYLENLSGISGLPLASLFASGGVLFIIVGVWVLKSIMSQLGTGRK